MQFKKGDQIILTLSRHIVCDTGKYIIKQSHRNNSLYTLGSCTGRASARGPGWPAAHGPGFNDILQAGPGAGLKLAGPGRARAGK